VAVDAIEIGEISVNNYIT